MLQLRELDSYLNKLLQSQNFQDYCPNGLQVQGKTEIQKIVGAVTASLACIETACAVGADALLVHHGLFWRGDDMRVVGLLKPRLQMLLKQDVNLLAYHLPLDVHPVYGNNSQLAAQLGWSVSGTFGSGSTPLGQYTTLSSPISGVKLAQHLEKCLGRATLHIPGRETPLQRIGWCTGAAQNLISAAYEAQLDAFISGEISEQTVHQAKEYQLDYFAAGHHATERYGVRSLLTHLSDKFEVATQFLEIDNPV